LALSPLVVLWLPTVAVAAPAGPYPTPDQDPFYAVPANIDSFANGALLDARSEQAVQVAAPIFADAWQLKYKTIDQHGNPSAFVTTVLVPQTPWAGGGARPLIAYQVAIDALSTKCNPSYILRYGAGCSSAGQNVLNSNAVTETANIVQAVQQGYAVEVPDWEGPTSEWIGDVGAARGVLDGIRAVMQLVPAGIDPSAPVGLIGYSGGALATNWALQTQPAYAPELRFVGAALGGTPASLHVSINAFAADSFGRGAIPLLIAGLERSYPQWHIEQYLSADGVKAVAASQDDCLLDALFANNGVDAATYEAYRGAIFDNPKLTTLMTSISPLGYPVVSRTPILFYHAEHDQFALIAEMQQLAARICREGVPVSVKTAPDGDHISYVTTGFPIALQYLTDRFRGVVPPNDCQAQADASVGVGTNAPDAGTNAPDVGTNAPGVGTNAPGVGTNARDAGTNAPGAGTNARDAGTEAVANGARDSSGCGCVVVGQRRSKGALTGVALVAALFCRRRRFGKRSRSSQRSSVT
jgi:hypothetical protein